MCKIFIIFSDSDSDSYRSDDGGQMNTGWKKELRLANAQERVNVNYIINYNRV